jgi:hypothetical protein
VLHKPSVCSSNQDSQQTAATARLELETCQSTSTLLMVSRFGQVELAACARLYPSVAQTLCLQQQPADSSRELRLNSFSRTSCRHSLVHLFVCVGSVKQILHPSPGCVGMLHKPVHAAATTTTGRQQNTEIAATAQPELSDVPMQASVHMPACSCVLVWSSRTCS